MVGRASPDELLAVATAGTRFASCLLLARILELPHPVNDPSHALARHHRWSRPDRADPCRSPCSLWAGGLRHRAQPADRAGAPRGVHRRRVVAHHAVRRRHRPVGAQSRSGLRLRIFLTGRAAFSQGQADHAGIRLSAPQCLPATRSRGASARKPGAPSQCHDMVRGGTDCFLAIGCKRNAAGSQGRCDG
jgi:hypothetical protein